ncbi:uncharacterized protein UTRI_03482 [Ustilago trichophora]|uniref:Uncharacterized protein n=1 Tax=Ustilago trichophora TaxID=86804 RepID=A0A5C3E0J7_9BASI|nr:uncharacterized protein UTRI_03482 [Ustilago trichophora]
MEFVVYLDEEIKEWRREGRNGLDWIRGRRREIKLKKRKRDKIDESAQMRKQMQARHGKAQLGLSRGEKIQCISDTRDRERRRRRRRRRRRSKRSKKNEKNEKKDNGVGVGVWDRKN